MRRQVLTLLLAICLSPSAFACSCVGPEAVLARIEAYGFSGAVEVFHGRVTRWVNPKEADIEVIEAFAGPRAPSIRHLVGFPGPGDTCGGHFAPSEEFVYLIAQENVVTLCSKLPATRPTVEAFARGCSSVCEVMRL